MHFKHLQSSLLCFSGGFILLSIMLPTKKKKKKETIYLVFSTFQGMKSK